MTKERPGLFDPDSIGKAADAVFVTASSAMKGDLAAIKRGEKRISLVIANAHRMTDEINQQVSGLSPLNHQPVCKEGCSACCHLNVVATATEIIAIGEYLTNSLDLQEMDRLRERIDAHIRLTEGKRGVERRNMRIPCPVLENNRCLTYPARPITCRGWNSLDQSICEADLESPDKQLKTPVHPVQYILSGRIIEGIRAASDHHGITSDLIDLPRGLQIVLNSQPDSITENWLKLDDQMHKAASQRVFPSDTTDPAEAQERDRLWKLMDLS